MKLFRNEINLVHITCGHLDVWGIRLSEQIGFHLKLPVACTWSSYLMMIFTSKKCQYYSVTSSLWCNQRSGLYEMWAILQIDKSDQSSSCMQKRKQQILSFTRHSCGRCCLIVRARMRRRSAPTAFCRELCKNREMQAKQKRMKRKNQQGNEKKKCWK